MPVIKVQATLSTGMILKRKIMQNNILDFAFVTAIGARGVLAISTDVTEHLLPIAAIQDYECFGYIFKKKDLHAYMDWMTEHNFVSKGSEIYIMWTHAEENNGREVKST